MRYRDHLADKCRRCHKNHSAQGLHLAVWYRPRTTKAMHLNMASRNECRCCCCRRGMGLPVVVFVASRHCFGKNPQLVEVVEAVEVEAVFADHWLHESSLL